MVVSGAEVLTSDFGRRINVAARSEQFKSAPARAVISQTLWCDSGSDSDLRNIPQVAILPNSAPTFALLAVPDRTNRRRETPWIVCAEGPRTWQVGYEERVAR